MVTKLTLVPPMRDDPVYPDAKRSTVFAEGIEFQDFVCELLSRRHIILQNLSSKKYQYKIGENLQGFEIKLDRECTRTRRLSIEIAEKSRADNPVYVPSGIYKNDNAWLYIQGNYEIIFIFGKTWLQQLHKNRPYTQRELPTIKTFYLPFSDALRPGYANKVIDLTEVPF